MQNILRYSFLTGLYVLLSFSSFAQDNGYSSNYWYFGNNPYGLNFSRNANHQAKLLTDQNINFGSSGSATAVDPVTGELLFYTDGVNVYDAFHQSVQNDNGNVVSLNGREDREQSVALAPVPGNDKAYFIFYTTTGGEILRTQIVINGQGEPIIQSADYNQSTGITAAQPAIKIVGVGPSPLTYYLFYQDLSNNSVKVATMNASGNFTGVTSFTTSVGLTVRKITTHLHSDTLSLGLVPREASKNLQGLDFITSSQTFTNNQQYVGTGKLNEVIADAAWASAGKNLYFSRNNPTSQQGNLYVYELDSQQVAPVFFQPTQADLGLKLGPDNKLYHIYRTSSRVNIAQITYPDSVVDSLQIDYRAFNNQDFAGSNVFPAELAKKDISINPNFTYYPAQICQNTEVTFMPKVTTQSDQYFWRFGDGTTSTAASPRHTYDTQGPYNVTLVINSGGTIDSVSQALSVTQFDVQIQTIDTTICKDQLPFTLDMSQNNYVQSGSGSQIDYSKLVWSGGDNTNGAQNTFQESGNYWVSYSEGGCSTYAPVTIRVYKEQKTRANVWYFGNKAGIDFNDPTGPQPLADGAMNAPEGCATICDQNGKLLFYTDGSTVWNKNHTVMPNGQNIGGSTASGQSSIIAPFPGNETMYYIFLTQDMQQPEKEFRFAIVDMKLDNGNGDVILAQDNSKFFPLFKENTERLTGNGGTGGYELYVHDYGNAFFRNYNVSNNGIEAPLFVNAGEIHAKGNTANGEGYLRMDPNGNGFAVAIAGLGHINLVKVDTATGATTTRIVKDKIQGTLYGLSYSPDGELLYATTQNPDMLLQIPVNDTLSEKYINDNTQFIDTPDKPGAIQQAPDGQLYIAAEGKQYLYRLTNPNTVWTPGFTPDLNNNKFALAAGTGSQLGLPNYIQNFGTAQQTPSMTVDAGCSADSVYLSASGTSDIDQFSWNITDRNTGKSVFTGTGEQVTVDFLMDPGSYNAEVRLYNVCGLDTLLAQPFTIFSSPDLSQEPRSATLCGSSATLGNNIPDSTGYRYVWNTGDTTRTITVGQQGYFSVQVTSSHGCVSNTNIFVGPPFVVDLGPDRSVCPGETVVLDAGVNANSYTWKSNGTTVQTGGSRTYTVPNTPARVDTVSVSIPDPVNPSCIVTDKVVLTINGLRSQVDSVNSILTVNCGGTNGRILLNTDQGSGDYTFQWFDPNGNSFVPSPDAYDAQNLAAGNYRVVVTDNLTGCTLNLNNLTISSTNITVTATVNSNTCPDTNTGEIQANVTGSGTAPFTIRLQDSQGNMVQTTTGTSATFSTLPADDYTIEVEDASGCKSYAQATIADNSNATLTASDLVGCSNVTLTANFSPSSATLQFVRVSDNQTFANNSTTNVPGQYVAELTNNGCTLKDTFNVTISTTPSVNITQDSQCGGVMLTANVTPTGGNYRYNWNTGDTTQTLFVTATGSYSVTVYNKENVSCANTANSTVGSIDQSLSFTLDNTYDCENDSIRWVVTPNVNTNLLEITWKKDGSVLPNETGTVYSIFNEGDKSTHTVSVSMEYKSGSKCGSVSKSRSFTMLPTYQPKLNKVYYICSQGNGISVQSFAMLDPGQFSEYNWTLPDGSTSTAATIKADKPGNYAVTVKVNGCDVSTSTEVVERCEPKIAAPNAFRPLSTVTENQTFHVFPNSFVGDQFQIIIYNRWGRIVYESSDINFQWDGNDFQGYEVPNGVYAYVMHYNSNIDGDNKTYKQTGSVTVVR